MIPELFRIGDFAISPFGLLMVLAFFAAYLQLNQGLKRLRIGDEDDASAIVLAAGIGGVLGAKIYYAILQRDASTLLERYGLVWYGGFVLGTLAVIWVLRRRDLARWETIDAAAPALALGYAVGRVGCFLVGDDYGVPTELPWGVAFAEGLPPTYAGVLRDLFDLRIAAEIPDDALLAVHPTQLYETLACLAIWWVGRRRLEADRPAGTVAATVIALLAVERFAVELLRAKDDRFLGPFTVAQAISVAVLATAIGLVVHLRSRSER
jgi:phosphatidylglycerol:prolipoprotein diacylglycerol transferase